MRKGTRISIFLALQRPVSSFFHFIFNVLDVYVGEFQSCRLSEGVLCRFILPCLRWLILLRPRLTIIGGRIVPGLRFARDEAGHLKPLQHCGSFMATRELSRRVAPDCAVEMDTNAYSVPWRLIGERVRVLVTAETVRVTVTSSRSGATAIASAKSVAAGFCKSPLRRPKPSLHQPEGGPVLHVALGPDPNVAGHCRPDIRVLLSSRSALLLTIDRSDA